MGFVKLFAEAEPTQKLYNWINWSLVLRKSCRVCEGDGGCSGVTRPDNTQQVPPHSRPQHIHHQLCSHRVTLLHTHRWHRGLINTFEGHGGAKVEEYSLVVTLTTFRHSSQDRGISEISIILSINTMLVQMNCVY